MRSHLRWFVVVLALGLVVSACGKDEAEQQPTGDGTSQPTGTDTGAQPTGDTLDQLLALGQEWANTTGRITYQITSTGAGTTEAPSQITLYWKPPSSWRMDIAGETGSSIIISSPGGSYICGEGEGAAGGGGTGSTCLALPADQAMGSNPFGSLFGDPGALEAELRSAIGDAEITTTQRTIAGLDATCFTATGGAQGDGEWCFSGTGLLVYMTGSNAQGDFTMEATEASTEVTDADFEPPYDVLEIPTGLPTG